MSGDPPIERFADLIVAFGANVQPGQIVAVGSEPGKEELTRAIATSAYRHGARFVDVAYFDPYVKRARIQHAPEETLDFVPSWYAERVIALGQQRCARIGLSGPVAPGLLDDLDPARAGRDQLPFVAESARVVNDRTTNWTIAPCPSAPWAQLVHPELDPAAALERLWLQVAHVCRLDESDPVAAWNERMDALTEVAARLTSRRFDAVHFDGEGTDLTVGLLPSSVWRAARFETVDGIKHIPNLPSEETFSAPDPERVDGTVRATRPLDLSGTIVRDLRVRFAAGRAVEIEASAGAEALRARCAIDDGAARLGEVALVDRHGRIGPLDTVFFDTLLDENAASHVALGNAYAFCVDDERDQARANRSKIHIDFMIGGERVDVTGVTMSGERIPLLRGGDWQI
ncbi:MAG TPA: aminopeptidase [Solirubrobacteraceae bacterium]|nr:aminopeptidase [Solirubrobacteraceae bacterium]